MIYVVIGLLVGVAGFVTFVVRSMSKKDAKIVELRNKAENFQKAYEAEKFAHEKTIANIKAKEEYDAKKEKAEKETKESVVDNTATPDAMLHILRNKAK